MSASGRALASILLLLAGCADTVPPATSPATSPATNPATSPATSPEAPPPAPSARPTHAIRKGLVAARLVESGALLSETFSTCTWQPEHWKLYRQSRSARLTFDGERFTVWGTSHGHDGLASQPSTPFKDLTLVGRMDMRAEGGASHVATLHLCGEDMPRSPDHWVEIAMSDGGTEAGFQFLAALPLELMPEETPWLVLPRQGKDGFLARIDLDGSRNLCSAFVHDGTSWRPLRAQPLELPIRLAHAELKIRVGGPPPSGDARPSYAWFDDIRMYPRAESHPVLVSLVGATGAIWRNAKGSFDPQIVIGDGPPRPLSDLTVELWSADGKVRVSATRSAAMGHYMLSLTGAPWPAYPVAAMVRLRLDGRIFGPDLLLPGQALRGVYPNDIWELHVE